MKTVIGGKHNSGTRQVTRRDFIRTSAAVSLTAMLPGAGIAFAAGSDTVRIGLIGCGGRGTGAAQNCIESSQGVELVAMGDLFKDRLDLSLKTLKEKLPADKVKVTRESSFVGFDAFKKVIAGDVDLVLLATPPHYRPEHLAAAVQAGKHVFMEKPVAVDPKGVRSVIASADVAKQNGLAIVAGTQRRHQGHYVDMMKRIHDGHIGRIVSGQCYWNQGGMGDYWKYYPREGLTAMEYQCRNWSLHTWLCGDHMVEQHVHNLDVMNWALGAHPVRAMGMGGREVRKGPNDGNIYDHFAVEYEYASGVRILSMCRQIGGCTDRISEHVVGTQGTTYTDGANAIMKGPKAYTYDGPMVDPYVQEHADLIASMRSGQPLNEAQRVAESTLTAIMGRMSAYTGRELSWDWVMNASELDLSPPQYDLRIDDLPVRPVAVPGQTQLI